MTRSAVRRLAQTLAFLASLATLAFLPSCGGGGVSGPAVTTGALAISPATAVVYSDLPAQFVITGGTAPYFITSSNGSAIPVPLTPFNYNTLIVVPGTVGTDTSVTLSATDAKNSTTVSSTVTVKPRTVSNVVTVSPTATCSGALCSGSDALVTANVSQAGVPLSGRPVRFDIVSGDLRVITSAPGASEVLALSGTTNSDSSGNASIRVRALPDAPTQTALLRITDVNSGSSQVVGVVITPAPTVAVPEAPLNAQPSTLEFQGTDAGTCASGISADVIVFGGKAPYQVSQPSAFSVTPAVVTSPGGRFRVTAIGQCSTSSAIAVVDANGSTVTVTASNKLSDLPAPAPSTPFIVSPTATSLGSCNDVATLSLSGGTGTYFATSGNTSITASVNNNVGTIRRVSTSTAPGTSSVDVQFSDGKATQTVTVGLTGDATGACPVAAPATPLTLTPPTVTLSSCSDVVTVAVTGGNGGLYTEVARDSGIALGGFTNFFNVRRRAGTSAPPSPTFVDVSDGSTVKSLQIDLTGPAAGSC